MGSSSSGRWGQFWRSDWFVGVLVAVAVVVLYQATRYASTSSSRKPSHRIAIIAIDDQTIANIGRWPWPRDLHAEWIDKLAGAKAQTIVHMAFFTRDLREVAFRAAQTRDGEVMAAGNAFVSAAATPGYDASEIDQQAPALPADKTIVMNKSGAPERPQAGGGNTGQEP